MNREFACLMPVALAAVLLVGCGARDDTGPTTTTRTYTGGCVWPASVGAVSTATVAANEVTRDGINAVPLATGTYTAGSAGKGIYEVPDVTIRPVTLVQVRNATVGGPAARLAAAVGHSLGRSRAMVLPLTVATTIAARAVVRLMQEEAVLSEQTIGNLEVAARAIVDYAAATNELTDFGTEAALDAAADEVLTVTGKGATGGIPAGMVGVWRAEGVGSASVGPDGSYTLDAGGRQYEGVLTVTRVTSSAGVITCTATTTSGGGAVTLALALSESAGTLTITLPDHSSVVLAKQEVAF